MPRISLVMSIGCLVVAAWLAGTGRLAAQAGPALAGKVTDGQEALEGVLVSAKRNGSTVTVTVVTGKGRPL
jgi:virginiamycin B lyase